jgi:ketosteroid isomerase-like protein
MSDRAEVENVLRAVYAARVRGDVDEIMRQLDPDVHFEIAGDPGASPVPGIVRGVSALRPHIAELIRLFRFDRYDLLSTLVDGAKASARVRVRITSTQTGVSADSEIADFIELKNGRISSYLQYVDTDAR